MPIRLDQSRTDPSVPRTKSPGVDPFIRLGEIFRLRTAHPPARLSGSQPAILEREEPSSRDDCMILHTSHIQQFRIEGQPAWAGYGEICSAFERMWRAGKGSGLRPFARHDVFAPVKVVLAETHHVDRLRAVLAWGPAYPWQNKLAVLNAGQPLQLAYAAVGVLNSPYGYAWYRRFLDEDPPRAQKPHGLKVAALKRVPIARRGHDAETLNRVADHTHQLMAIHEARQACLPAFQGVIHEFRGRRALAQDHYARVFELHARAVQQRINPYLKLLGGLSDEREEDALLHSSTFEMTPQPALLDELDLLPYSPGPPVRLFSPEEARWWDQLQEHEERDPGRNFEKVAGELGALKLLRFWDEAINRPPPTELVSEPGTG